MGGDETSYRAFKKEWNYVIQAMKVKSSSKSNYLMQCLTGKTKDKISAVCSTTDPVEAIWDRLDAIYDSHWKIANATIEKLFSTPAPLATFNSVDQFWYAAGKIVTNINHLELTGENLATM